MDFEGTNVFAPIPNGPYVYASGLDALYNASQVSDDAFVYTVIEMFGIDLDLAAKFETGVGSQSIEGEIAGLIAEFGADAFGTYLPWHAFRNSPRTPWGMYIFLNPLWKWACGVFAVSKALPTPKPTLLTVLRLLFNVIYRHELFHYHVERFSLRQEVIQRKPIYRPYVDDVEPQVRGTERWLEEALAQAVVLNSTLLSNRSGLSKDAMRKVLIPEFDKFPPGYRDYECKSYGGVPKAHRYLASQIVTGAVKPSDQVTDLAIPKTEYNSSADAVPGYLAVDCHSIFWRFQLARPKDRELEFDLRE